MRVTAILLAAAIFAAPAFAEKEATGPVYEPDTYRFGGTYSVASSQSPSQCAQTCGRDTNCKAWSFVDLPGPSTQNACELKSNLGRAEVNPTSVSGISPSLEAKYQPSQFGIRTLAGGRTHASTTTRTLSGGTRSATRSHSSVTSSTPRRVSTPTRSPVVRRTAPSNRSAVTTRTPTRVSTPVRRTAPAAPTVAATRSTTTTNRTVAPATRPTTRTVSSAPRTTTTTSRSQPISVNTRTTTTATTSPKVAFTPLKRTPDGTYRTSTSSTPVAASTSSTKQSRVVLTGPKGADVGKAVHGRVVLQGDMTGPSAGGVGESPAAPISRNAPVNAQGERVPYKDISSREYPNYSVTRAAEDGAVAPIGNEAGS